MSDEQLVDYIVTLATLVGWTAVFNIFRAPTPDPTTTERIHRQLDRCGSEGEVRQRLWARAFIAHCREHGIDFTQCVKP